MTSRADALATRASSYAVVKELTRSPKAPELLPFLDPGGDDRIRTGDPLLAKQVLSQLSYIPTWVVGLGRVELPTSRLSGARSNHLSYRPQGWKINATGSREW